jgi:hypothetical protein
MKNFSHKTSTMMQSTIANKTRFSILESSCHR